jgi:hypothetical protein
VVDECVLRMADRVAELLPEAPGAHDAFGYLAWEELVLSSARRIQARLDSATLLAGAPQGAVSLARLDGRALVTLAVTLAYEPDGETCASVLAALASAGRTGHAAAFVPRG